MRTADFMLTQYLNLINENTNFDKNEFESDSF